MQPLDSLKIADFSRYLAGPYSTMMLADLGAEVVKIERPGLGDDSRSMNPIVNGESYPSAMPNRNKRSLALDLKADVGRDVALDIIAASDVVVESFRPGVTQRLGIDYEAAKAVNPDIIYCSISGFGQTGPNSRRAGFDIIAQGMTGFMRMTGAPEGEPAKFGIAVNDLSAGMIAANSMLAAYVHRLKGGRGQYIDISLLDVGLALTVWEAGAWFGAGEEPRPLGTRHRYNAPYQAFRTADGYVTVGAPNQKLWESLCKEVIDQPDLIDRPEYRDASSRPLHSDQLENELQAIFETEPTDHWVTLLDSAGVPGGPVYTYSDALAQEQVAARGLVQTIEHPKLGEMKILGSAVKLSETPATVRRPAPLLGEHTREVLAGLGYPNEKIDALIASGSAAEETGE